MSELDNLQKADGKEEIKRSNVNEDAVTTQELTDPNTETETENEALPVGGDVPNSEKTEMEQTDLVEDSAVESEKEAVKVETAETKDSETVVSKNNDDDDLINEIDDSNAEDAEDEGNKDRHKIEVKEYDKMSLEALAIELEKLVKSEKVQAIKTPVDTINSEFKTKLNELIEEKKEDFLNDGGDEIDFYYSSPVEKRYKAAYKDYRTKIHEHYKSLENNLKQNLADKLEIIEELKGLINVEENINTTYKHFKELQERWRKTGPIPRDKYNNAWNSYHHHVEIFYDFLHLNRDLRDLDFKHNLEKKLLIIGRAEELAQDDDVMRSFRELQELHKMWKEELGPVGKEYREDIWERFKIATKIINDKRQVYYQHIDKIHEINLERKLEIIAAIEVINNEKVASHSIWQKKIKEIESLRENFFNAGKVPIKVNEETWSKFKTAVRIFNKNKNAFYKDLKKEQYTNLQKKLDLIQIAEDNKDNEDKDATTALMKRIQSDWKKIGHVPRKDSDKIWKKFKNACNHYFETLHASKNAENKANLDAFSKKYELLDSLKTLKIVGDKEKDLETISDVISQWNSFGRVPNDKRYIEGKFNKMLDELFTNTKIDKNEIELIKFENKLEDLNSGDNTRNLDNERIFIRKKIDEVKGQINQLENNLQFFTNVDDENPLVREVHNNIKDHKNTLSLWITKLSKIKELY